MLLLQRREQQAALMVHHQHNLQSLRQGSFFLKIKKRNGRNPKPMLLGSEVHLTMVAGNVITILDSLKAIFDSVLEMA